MNADATQLTHAQNAARLQLDDAYRRLRELRLALYEATENEQWEMAQRIAAQIEDVQERVADMQLRVNALKGMVRD